MQLVGERVPEIGVRVQILVVELVLVAELVLECDHRSRLR